MARYVGFYAGGWHKIAEARGHIKAYAGGAHPLWFDIKQVDMYANGWHTVWQLPAAQAAHITKPPVHETRYHTVKVNVRITGRTASWSIPTGRHVVRQTLTYYTGVHGSQKHTVTPRPLDRSNVVLTGAVRASVTYTYY